MSKHRGPKNVRATKKFEKQPDVTPPVDAEAVIVPPVAGPLPPPPSWFGRIDWIIAAVLFVAGTILGTQHILHSATRPSFYQEYFAPAVAAGCGMGFVTVTDTHVSSLGRFVAGEIDSISCDEVRKSPSLPVSAWHTMHRYQMGAAGLIWRIRGEVSWRGLAPLFGLLFGLTLPISYAIARILLQRWLALAVALVLLVSPLHLGVLPLLRDYSKAPFFLGIIMMIGICVRSRLTFRGALLAAAAAGVIAGLGFGFRTDVLVCVPPMLFALFALVAGPWRETWKQRLLAPVVFLVVFILVALPPLRGTSEAGANAHVTLLGFSTPFDAALGIDRPFYDWAYAYNDTHINALLSGYSNWKDGNTKPYQTNTQPYEKSGNEYLVAMARNFPADILTRAYAAVLRTLELPATGLANKLYLDPNQHAIGFTSVETVGRYLTLHRALQLLTSGGAAFVLFTLASVLIIAARSVRVALGVAFVVLYFCAYTFLQFSLRHVFHLEIFGWLAAAFVLQSVVVAVRAWRRRDDAVLASLDWKPVLGLALVTAIVPATVLYALRAYQDGHVRELIAKYLAAEKEPVAYSIVNGSSTDRVLLRIEQEPAPVGTMRLDYLVFEVRNDRPSSPLLFRNKAILSPAWDQTRTVFAMRPPSFTDAYPSDITRYFFPAYSGPESVFEGMELSRDAVSSVAGIYRIKRTAELPLLLWLTLHPDWRDRPQHQSLVRAELRNTVRLYHDAPAPARGFAEELSTSGIPLGKVVRETGGSSARVHGFIDAAGVTLLQYPAKEVRRGAAFVVEGTNHYGCITPILSGNAFLAVSSRQPGPFRFEIPVPADGTYTPIIANLECFGPNDFSISRAGWTEP